MAFITKLAREKNLIIVATIHQPSSKVYDNFDQVLSSLLLVESLHVTCHSIVFTLPCLSAGCML